MDSKKEEGKQKKESSDLSAEEILWEKLAKRGELSKNNVEELQKALLKASEISLILDTYDDIFSDFDPRPFHSRAISDDFLIELKRATKDTPGGKIELKLLMPDKQRSEIGEDTIKRRLRDHFKKHYLQSIDELKSLRIRGIVMAAFGILMIFAATLLFAVENSSILIKFLITVLEPAGWFTAWTGLEDIYYTGREMKKNLSFYEKMSQAEIVFLSY